MKDFDLLCKEFEKMDGASYAALLAEKSVKLLPILSVISADGIDGSALFASFILGAIAADGKLSKEEYTVLSPSLHAFFGDGIDFETCKAVVKQLHSESRALKNSIDLIVDALGNISEDLKDDIILVCLMVCAVDGKVSMQEKRWIKQLIK